MNYEERRAELMKELEALRMNLQNITISIHQHEGAIALCNEALEVDSEDESTEEALG